MKKLLTLILLVPSVSFADLDISNCVVIGHQVGTNTTKNCNTAEDCEMEKDDSYPRGYELCMKNVKTPEECAKWVAEENKKIESENLVYRCPATDYLLSQKVKEKTGKMHNLVDNDGVTLDQDAMVADTENVYLFRHGAGLAGFIGHGSYSIFGPSEDGYNLAHIE